jgi:hypothetical protein
MKKKFVLLSAVLTMFLFAAVTGCDVDDDDFYGYFGSVTFWNDDPTLSDIAVTVDGTNTDYIEVVSNVGPGYCNRPDYANFYLSEGYHTYLARTVDGIFVNSGNFYVSGACTIIYIP